MTRLLSITTSTLLLALVANTACVIASMVPCKHELGHLRHLETRYLVGSVYHDGSIFGICRNGILSCYEDHALADAPLSEHTQVNCSSNLIHARRRRLGVLLSTKAKTWPNGIVYYRIANNFTAAQKDLITQAMANVVEQSGIKVKFVDCKTSKCGKNYIDIINKQDACFSSVGCINSGAQRMNLAKGCFNNGPGSTMHEILHALGMHHEHTHPKRQVIVMKDEDTSVSPSNLAINTKFRTTPYDLRSMTHYGRSKWMCLPLDPSALKRFCNGVNSKNDCVEPTKADCDDSRDKEFGQRVALSAGDAETLRKLYGGTKPSTPPEDAHNNQVTSEPPLDPAETSSVVTLDPAEPLTVASPDPAARAELWIDVDIPQGSDVEFWD